LPGWRDVEEEEQPVEEKPVEEKSEEKPVEEKSEENAVADDDDEVQVLPSFSLFYWCDSLPFSHCLLGDVAVRVVYRLQSVSFPGVRDMQGANTRCRSSAPGTIGCRQEEEVAEEAKPAKWHWKSDSCSCKFLSKNT
jgi:hypothetical protein